jgi:hypothetical protein
LDVEVRDTVPLFAIADVPAPAYAIAVLPVGCPPFAVKASVMLSCDIMGPLRGIVLLAAMTCGLSGLVAGEFTKLVFLE